MYKSTLLLILSALASVYFLASSGLGFVLGIALSFSLFLLLSFTLLRYRYFVSNQLYLLGVIDHKVSHALKSCSLTFKSIIAYFSYFLIRKQKNKKMMKAFGYGIAIDNEGSFNYLIREIFIEKIYQINLEKNNPIIIDCGANIGLATLFFKHCYPQAQVIAIEANPSLAKILKQNIKSNRLTSVSVIDKAASFGIGSMQFDWVSSSSTGFLTQEKSEQSISIETFPLSSIIDQPIDLLKMDIEGGEIEVMADLDQSGALTLIKNIIMEFHGSSIEKCRNTMLFEKNYLSRILKTLEKYHFDYAISPGAFPGIYMIHAKNKRLHRRAQATSLKQNNEKVKAAPFQNSSPAA